jgi:serine protease SohB
MIDALIQLGLFAIQTIIVIAAILIIIGGIIAIVTKGKIKGKTKIKLRKLNKHYQNLAETINAAILSKAERKQLAKKEKKNKKTTKKNKKKEKKSPEKNKKRIFVINFEGDLKASAVSSLREEITAILTVATPKDEVIVRLESSGGTVHGYGLAASQLQRIRDKFIPLTITVDKVAASGGYMMASVADKILAAPFAIIGSIGVVAQLPNFHKLLKKHDIDFEQITAGEYKRTLTLFGENTRRGRHKLQEDIEEAHELFKDFIKQHRPQIDIAKVATGEYWFAKRALDLKLVDELVTSDDYLLQSSKAAELFEVTYKKKKKWSDKIFSSCHSTLNKIISLWHKQAEENSYL